MQRKKMAKAREIKYYATLDEATVSLHATDFDYFFSIINGAIIPKILIERALTANPQPQRIEYCSSAFIKGEKATERGIINVI